MSQPLSRFFFILSLLIAFVLPASGFAQQTPADTASPTTTATSAPPSDARPRTIELYATQWCGYCQRVRMLLQQRNLPFTEIDIERSPEGLQRFQQLGGRGTPLLVIDGYVIRGYNEQAILNALTP